ncbi:SGNH hydrolase domain-containing protein [Marinomonas profundi]|uniref:SGNH hydrolase domain-containing protein n=1 Tax=Marinomonas profundi TaxID=2726122 RepID=UPI001D11C25D|nr:SGNH hydrolase domain-containing protein [Marinomonas profundi]
MGVSDKENRPVDCFFNDLDLAVISIGDSHNSATFTALGVAAEKSNLNAMHWAKGSCPLLKGAKYQNREPGCHEFNEKIFARLNGSFENIPVVLTSRLTRALVGGNEEGVNAQGRPQIYFTKEVSNGFSPAFQAEFRKSLIETSCLLVKKRPVYLVRPIPEIAINVPATLARNMLFGRGDDDIKITLADYHQRNKLVWDAQDQAAQQCGVKILDPLPYLCDDEYCYGSRDGRPLYYDDDHLSEYGNKFLVPMFEQVFKDQ